MEKLDAIFFSPHKFLGGPGSSGVLVFDSTMYHSDAPDNPGGGTVDWTNTWQKDYLYLKNKNEFIHRNRSEKYGKYVTGWFQL